MSDCLCETSEHARTARVGALLAEQRYMEAIFELCEQVLAAELRLAEVSRRLSLRHGMPYAIGKRQAVRELEDIVASLAADRKRILDRARAPGMNPAAVH